MILLSMGFLNLEHPQMSLVIPNCVLIYAQSLYTNSLEEDFHLFSIYLYMYCVIVRLS